MDRMNREPSVTDLLKIFLRHWKLIVIVLGAALLTVPVLSRIKPPSYQSRAGLLIKFGKQTIQQNPAGGEGAYTTYMAQFELAVKSEIEVLRNEYLAQRVVDDLGPDFDTLPPGPPPEGLWDRIKAAVLGFVKRTVLDPLMGLLYKLQFMEKLPPYEAAIRRVLGGLDVNNVQNTSVLEVTYRSSSPRVAQRVLDRLIQFYMEHHMNVQRTMGVVDFFNEQLLTRTEDLREAEGQFERFREEYNIANIKQQINILLSTSSELGIKRSNFDLELIALKSKYSENAPEIRKVRDQIAETEKAWQRVNAELKRLSEALLEHQRLERNLAIAEKAFLLYNSKREENEILEAMDVAKISNVSIIQPASLPPYAVRIMPFIPDRGLFLILATFLGLLVGVGLAVTADYMDPTLGGSQDLEDSLGVKIWGVIPESRELRKPLKQIPGRSGKTPRGKASSVDQEVHNLATQVLLEVAKHPEHRALFVAYSRTGEGSTTILSRLAMKLAEDSRVSILLVDGNLRSPEIHSVWDLPSSPGLSDLLAQGELEAGIRETRFPNLSVLPAGGNPANHMELFFTPEFKGAVARLKEGFDLILFDCAPLLSYKDALALGSHLDGAILLVRSHFASRHSVQRCVEALNDRGIPVCGAVLNRNRAPIPKFLMRLLGMQDEG